MTTKYFWIFLIVVPAFSWAQTQYVVRKGDTLLKIADQSLGNKEKQDPRRYEFVLKIQALNPDLKNPNVLEAGQNIILPIAVKPAKVEKIVTSAPSPAETFVPPAIPTPFPTPVTVPEPHVAPQPAEISALPALAEPVLTSPAPALVAAPAPLPVVETPKAIFSEKQEVAHSNFFMVQPRFQTLKLTTKELASDTEVKLNAQSSAGLDLQYGIVLNNHFHLLFQTGVSQTQFNDIEGNNATLEHKSEALTSYAIGVGFEPTPRLHMDLLAVLAERTYLLPETLPAYVLKAIAQPGAELNISWDFYSGVSNIFGISVIGEYFDALKKDNIEYKSELEPMAALYWKTDYPSSKINYKVTLTYKQGHQKTNLTEQEEDVGVLGIGLIF